MLKEISIEIIRKCPNYCLHCSSMSNIDCSEILDYNLFTRLVDDASKLGAKTICLSGGEPFIHPRIIDIINYIHEKKLECFIYSSGIFLNKNNKNAPLSRELLESVSGKVKKIIFNIEAATEKTYDLIMGTIGCFQIMQDSIKNAHELSITTEAHFVPMKPNINEIEKVIELCNSLHVSRLSFLRLVVHGNAKINRATLELTSEELSQLKNKLIDLKNKYSNVLDIRIGIPLSEEKECHKCEAASGKINIRYDGYVFPCEVFKNDIIDNSLNGFSPDNINNISLYDIYENSEYLKYIRDYSKKYKKENHSEVCVGQYLLTKKMANKDLELMQKCINSDNINLFITDAKKYFTKKDEKYFNVFYSDTSIDSDITYFEFPLDKDVKSEIENIIKEINKNKNPDEYEIFRCQKEIRKLWSLLIEKSIKCLRFFDEREPYIKKAKNSSLFTVNEEKKPSAHGVDALTEYFDKFVDFENVLYGSSNKYRDHVIHVFRTWLMGIKCLVKNEGIYIKNVYIDDKKSDIQLNYCEKLSMWTIIALTHDLGYPLDKSNKIIEKTHSMISSFINNPDISINLSFQGAQNYMNDFVVRLMSSKMEIKNKKYYARIQPKYYFKLLKSLEKSKHGIISTLIIYKLLTYFLESEYNVNEDYPFNAEERRQFYIRREILRSIASHTCKDIYHLNIGSFPFFLIVADDTQEWGRKYISDLYVLSKENFKRTDIDLNLNIIKGKNKDNECIITEAIELNCHSNTLRTLIKEIYLQSSRYVMLFRDGKDTKNRDFLFKKYYHIKYKEISKNEEILLIMELSLDKLKKSVLMGTINYSNDKDTNSLLNEKYFIEIFETDEILKSKWNICKKNDIKFFIKDKNDSIIDFSNENNNLNEENWKTGTVIFPLPS